MIRNQTVENPEKRILELMEKHCLGHPGHDNAGT